MDRCSRGFWRARIVLSLAAVVLPLLSLPGCNEGCSGRIAVAGQADRARTVEQLAQEVIELGFEERKNPPVGSNEWRFFYVPGGGAAGYSVAISIRTNEAVIPLSFGIAGTNQFSPAGIDLYRRLIQRLQDTYGFANVKGDPVNSCGQSLM